MGIPTVAVLDVCVPSSVFLYNNIKKVENGEKARGTVVFAQGAKIAEAVAKYHDNTAKSASEAFNIFGKYAETNRVLNAAGKGVNWATHNVNPLICVSAAYKTLTSDDKVHTGITQLGAISGMFLGEGLMKQNMGKFINEENVVKLAEKVKDVKGFRTIANAILNGCHGGKVASIIKGVAFVCASMTSYDLGQKLAGGVADRLCTNLERELPDGVESEQEADNDKQDDCAEETQKIDRMV